MARPCSVCTRPDRQEIDTALVIERASLRDVARRYGTTKDSLARHKAHIPASLTKAREAAEIAKADTLLARVRRSCGRIEGLLTASEEIMQEARVAKDGKIALEAIRTAAAVAREFKDHCNLLGQLSGELREGSQQPLVQAIIMMPGPKILAGGRRAEVGMPSPSAALPAPGQGEAIEEGAEGKESV